MADLRAVDVRAVLNAVSTIHTAHSIDNFGPTAVAALRELVAGNGHGFNIVDSTSGLVVASTDPPECLAVDRIAAFNRHLHQHPVFLHTLETPDPSALAISDFLSAQEFESLALYGEFYQGIDARDQLSVVTQGPRFTVAFVVNRDRRTFNTRDRARLELFRPHLEDAYRRVLEVELYRSGLDGSALSMVAIDEHGQLRATSLASERCLREYFGSDSAGQLARWVDRCRLAARASSPATPPPLPLIVKRDYRRLEVRYVAGLYDTNALLLLREWSSAADPATLMQRFRISSRQARILAHLASGKSDREIAGQLDLAHRTVTTMLHGLYRLLGVNNRTAAVALVFEEA